MSGVTSCDRYLVPSTGNTSFSWSGNDLQVRSTDFLNFRLAAHAKSDDFRILVQEPLLDNRIAERLAVTLGNQTHFAELVVILLHGFRIAVGHDVVFHELIGQAVV